MLAVHARNPFAARQRKRSPRYQRSKSAMLQIRAPTPPGIIVSYETIRRWGNKSRGRSGATDLGNPFLLEHFSRNSAVERSRKMYQPQPRRARIGCWPTLRLCQLLALPRQIVPGKDMLAPARCVTQLLVDELPGRPPKCTASKASVITSLETASGNTSWAVIMDARSSADGRVTAKITWPANSPLMFSSSRVGGRLCLRRTRSISTAIRRADPSRQCLPNARA